MRFLSIFKTAETGIPPTAEHMATMQKLVEEGMKAGWLIATEGCLPSTLGARVRSSGGKLLVTDGPFAESKEVIAGYFLIEAKDLNEARQIAENNPIFESTSTARIEVRPIKILEGING